MISHFNIHTTDIDAANKIFGCDIPSLKGKKVRRNPPLVVSDCVTTPRQLKEIKLRLMVAADVMFVIWIISPVSVSRGIKLKSVEYTTKRMALVLSESLEKVYDIYIKRGFTVDLFLRDREFECLRDNMTGTSDQNTTAEKDHVADIEGQIRVMKEQARAIWSLLTFKKVPGRIKMELIVFVVLWLNFFLPESGA